MLTQQDVRLKELYLDLLKRSLMNLIYGGDCNMYGQGAEYRQDPETGKLVLVKGGAFSTDEQMKGKIWPSIAHTMIGQARLNNLQWCMEQVIENNIAGDMIETGVWRGGACILMRGVLKAYGITNRRVFVADSFEGLPPTKNSSYPQDLPLDWFSQVSVLAVSLEEVQANFERYGLLDNQVVFLKGWFKDTLPQAPIDRLAILRLDGDLYESTMDGLNNLYHKVSPGGFVIVDDYHAVGACKIAVHDFRDQHGIQDPIIPIDEDAVYWQRSA